jgi:hypothetical protein
MFTRLRSDTGVVKVIEISAVRSEPKDWYDRFPTLATPPVQIGTCGFNLGQFLFCCYGLPRQDMLIIFKGMV